MTKGCHQYRRDDDAEQMTASRGVPLRIAISRMRSKEWGRREHEIVVGRRYVDNAREERIMNLVSQGAVLNDQSR